MYLGSEMYLMFRLSPLVNVARNANFAAGCSSP